MKKLLFGLVLFGCTIGASAQLVPPASVSTTDDIFSIDRNPAGLAINDGIQFGFSGNIENGIADRYGLYLGGGQDNNISGLGMRYNGTNYTYTYGSGAKIVRGSYFGFSLDFGEMMAPQYNLGLTVRPTRFISLGGTADNITENNGGRTSYTAGLALRPFGNRFTIAADAVYRYDFTSDEYTADARAFLSTELVNGLALNGYYDNTTETVGIGVGFNLPHHKVEAVSDVSGDGWIQDGIAAYRYSASSMRTVVDPVKEDKFVLLTLDGPIIEEKMRSGLFSVTPGRTLTNFILQMERYSRRKDIAGIVLYIKNVSTGPAKLKEMRDAIDRFRDTGKKVYVYMDEGGNLQYYLASVADKVFMNPAGSLWLTGLSMQQIYIKGLLDKIGVKAEFVHVGEYKSAGDMFTEDSTTEANALQLNAYLDDVYDMFTSGMAESRGMSQREIQSVIDQGPFTPSGAREAGLVDSLIYHDELKKMITEENGNDEYELMSETRYNRRGEWHYNWETPLSEKIAVVYAVGQITTGKSQRSPLTGTVTMGSETISNAIRKARKDKTVKAILLRIDSPGGSGLASDIIWREIHLTVTGDNPKPVIVSMSDLAASGGYYIAMNADTIIADPATITGSIGVIAGTFSMDDLFDKAGVNMDVFKRGEHSNFFSVSDSMTTEEREKLYSLINDFYQDFIGKVADGRGMTTAQVDSLGRGRIYSGEGGKDAGFVDEVGGLKRALEITKEKIGVASDEDVALEFYPKYSVDFLQMFNGTDIMAKRLEAYPALQKALREMDRATLLSNQEALYLLPYMLEVR
ncbi:MAG: signal peptide peptidase SppA [Candidatus Marinimicrobia bacterium]|nr:signal peptide peptidase SppA [Candidatus Neomarinimicrobiota bacterium]MCF7829204.1 signal peptide peptidase SppA [Candidatus Neomarinimicrobiota bacterium]MCF7881143.1 signal peptide peptidase SppA [Candidatus Neomarinimicrobiota bacterium]